MSVAGEFGFGGERLRVQLDPLGGGRYRVHVGDRVHEVEARRLVDGRVRFVLDGETFTCAAGPRGTTDAGRRGDVHVSLGRASWFLESDRSIRRRGAEAAGADGAIVAPMTGTVLKILVAVGDPVAAADTVAVVSAMKMEHKLHAGIAGTVAEVAVAEGATVDQDQLILRIEPASPAI